MHFMTILFFVSKIQSSLCYNSLYNFYLQQTRRKIRNKNRHYYSILSFFFSIIFFSQISSVTSIIILFFSISFTGTSTLSSDTSVFYVCMQCSRFARMNIYVFTFLFRGLDNSFLKRGLGSRILCVFSTFTKQKTSMKMALLGF